MYKTIIRSVCKRHPAILMFFKIKNKKILEAICGWFSVTFQQVLLDTTTAAILSFL